MKIAGDPREIVATGVDLAAVSAEHHEVARALVHVDLPAMPASLGTRARSEIAAVAGHLDRHSTVLRATADGLSRRGYLLALAAGETDVLFGGGARAWRSFQASLRQRRKKRRVDLKDPRLAHTNLNYREKPGKKRFSIDLKGARFSADEVRQGYLGDCYFAAAVAAIAATPGGSAKLRSLITDNHDGTYTVAFADGKRVTVDGDLYVWKDGSVVDGQGPRGANWFSILEKAYAARKEHHDDYDAIQGGFADPVFTVLIGGKKRDALSVDGHTSANAVWNRISGAIDGHPAQPACVAMNGETLPSVLVVQGASDGHEMSVLDVRTSDNGERWVKIRNPWGSSGSAGGKETFYKALSDRGAIFPDVDDGTFTMKVEDLTKVIDSVETP